MPTRAIAACLALLLLLPACAKSERFSAVDFVKQVATESRTKLRVQVEIRASADEPTDADKELLKKIEEAIDRRNVGRLVSTSSQAGSMFVVVEVENTADATTALHSILKDAGIMKRSSFKVIQPE